MKKSKLVKRSPAKLKKLVENPETVSTFCTFIAGGGFSIDFCNKTGVSYAEFMKWIGNDNNRLEQYQKAKGLRDEYLKELVTREITNLMTAQTTGLFDKDHCIKPPDEWPEVMPSIIAGLEVKEVWDWREEEDPDTGRKHKVRYQSGVIKKIKFWPKDKALDMAGKIQAMFVERGEITHHITLEQMVTASLDDKVTAKVIDVEAKEVKQLENGGNKNEDTE